jgi:DNA ligase-associated metallophosphoesterase
LPDLELTIAGETLALLPERAAYWPRDSTLFVADAHFGKAAAFRAHGIPVPRGTTAASLARLDAVLARRDVRRIAFLGDFLHARAGRAPATLEALAAWRRRRAALDIVLVRGNHDRHAGDPPAELAIRTVSEPHRVGPFALHHEPVAETDAYALAGHLHPAFVVRARATGSVRLPCFVFGENCGVLPAFGAFTGGHPVERSAGGRIYVVAEDRVLPVPV